MKTMTLFMVTVILMYLLSFLFSVLDGSSWYTIPTLILTGFALLVNTVVFVIHLYGAPRG